MPLGTASLINTIVLPFNIAGRDRRVRGGRTNTGLVEKAQQVLADSVSDQGLLSDRALDLVDQATPEHCLRLGSIG